jgi:hypothetical protein
MPFLNALRKFLDSGLLVDNLGSDKTECERPWTLAGQE